VHHQHGREAEDGEALNAASLGLASLAVVALERFLSWGGRGEDRRRGGRGVVLEREGRKDKG